MIPLSVPNFEGNEEKYVLDAVGQGWVSTGGAYITELEKRFASFVKTEDAIACQSGTSALHLSLIESGVGYEDAVLVSPLTFIAAVNPIRYCGAEPVFIDCDDSLCMDPIKLSEYCEKECFFKDDTLFLKANGRKVKAVIVIHVFGNMADMVSINEIAEKYHLKVIEDATEALGTMYTEGKYKGRFAGTLGDFGAYSFNGNKIITTGGGGMVTAKDNSQAQHIRYLSTQAKDDVHFYIHNEVGFNYRMTNVQGAIGVAQMEFLEEFIRRKNRNYDLYRELLGDSEKYKILPFREGTRSNKWFYSLFVNYDTDMRKLIGTLAEHGVQTRMIWGLICDQKPYLDCLSYYIEKARVFANHVINLPCSTNLKEEDVYKVCEVLREVL